MIESGLPLAAVLAAAILGRVSNLTSEAVLTRYSAIMRRLTSALPYRRAASVVLNDPTYMRVHRPRLGKSTVPHPGFSPALSSFAANPSAKTISGNEATCSVKVDSASGDCACA